MQKVNYSKSLLFLVILLFPNFLFTALIYIDHSVSFWRYIILATADMQQKRVDLEIAQIFEIHRIHTYL